MERLTDYYYRPRKYIPSLDLANGSQRQQRSERREACLAMLYVLLAYTEVASLRVGRPTKSGFVNFTVPWLARRSGLSLKRAERALADLKAANIVTVSQARILQPDGTWKGLAAVKAISRHLFAAFGLNVMLRLQRDRKAKELKKRALEWGDEGGRPTTLTQVSRFRLLHGAYEETDIADPKKGRGAQHGSSYRKLEKTDNKNPLDFERRRQLQLIAIEIMAEHPELSKEQVYELAAKRQGRFSA